MIVKSQAELDAVPVDFNGRVVIRFGTPYNRAVVNRRFKYSVEARENSSVVARENSSVVAWGNSSVEAWENSSVEARENSSVEAWGNSSVVACGNSSVVARENSSVVAWGNSSVEARENSSVEARENSSVEAWGNSQIVDRSRGHKIKTSGNARVVYDPRTIEEYADAFDLEITDGKVKLYKAVHKSPSGEYFSDFNSSFTYAIGETAKADGLTANPEIECGHGIHMAHKAWCVRYGRSWPDLAILELEADASGVVVPPRGAGKVRAAEAKVLREVPLEECGLLGKFLAKRMEAV